MNNLAILVSIFMSAGLSYIISDYYNMAPPIYLLIVLIALALFIQALIFVLTYNDIDDEEVEQLKR